MNPYTETHMHTGSAMGMSGPLGTSFVPPTSGKGLSSTLPQNMGYAVPSSGPVGSVQDLSGLVVPKAEEKTTSTAPTQGKLIIIG